MPAAARRLCRIHQGGKHLKIRHGWELDGGVLPAGALHAHRAGGHHDIAAGHLQLDAPAGAHPHKGVRTEIGQLLHGDGSGGPADAGGGDAHLLPQQRAGIGNILPVGHHVDGVFKIPGDLLAPPRVAGEQAVPSHVALLAVDVKLPFRTDHGRTSFP